MNSPTVAAFLQRSGRTDRRPGTTRNCLFLAIDSESLLWGAGLLHLREPSFAEPVARRQSPGTSSPSSFSRCACKNTRSAVGSGPANGTTSRPSVILRPVRASDLAPPGMRPDQHLLGQVLGRGAITSKHRCEPQDTRQPLGRESPERRHTSAPEVPPITRTRRGDVLRRRRKNSRGEAHHRRLLPLDDHPGLAQQPAVPIHARVVP